MQNMEATESNAQPQNSIVEEVRVPKEERRSRQKESASTCPNHSWITQLQSLSDDIRLREDTLDEDEEQFFRELTAKYLQPLPENKKEQKQMANNLNELRNKINFIYFILNAFWLISTFTLQLLNSTPFIQVPKLDINLNYTGEYVAIEPLGFMFILTFIFLVFIQFLAMLYHRIQTLIHYVEDEESDEESDDDEDLVFSRVLNSYGGGILV
ncbi:hypothetical protein FQN60_007057 [Etheostoma spectabile]|uniref:Uncharacterized protein n=1 Tax=Etheostoma spectabile TaxID=54343 RepID=A0A5J5CA12_9PERO|nr:hypothetical protein FQN60_007057 [Etheostoma spectabile]